MTRLVQRGGNGGAAAPAARAGGPSRGPWRRPRPTDAGLPDLLDRLRLPIALFRPDGSLAYANPALRALSVRRAGLALGRRGTIELADPAAARRFAVALRACLRPGPPRDHHVTLRRAPGGAVVQVLHLHALPTGGAMLQATAPPPTAAGVPASERLRLMFGLTQAEAALAGLLAAGLPPAEAAAARGVGLPTVRTQIRALLAKTGAARLHELTALLAGALR